jgi:hypothetical protein
MHHIKTYTITLMPKTGGYQAVCLGVPGCVATGVDRRHALERIEDVIKDRIRDNKLAGRPVPVDRTSTKFLWLDVEEFLV